MSFCLVPEEYNYIPSKANIEAVREFLSNLLGNVEIDHWESEQAQVVGLLSYGTAIFFSAASRLCKMAMLNFPTGLTSRNVCNSVTHENQNIAKCRGRS
jgi:hypothetical protein